MKKMVLANLMICTLFLAGLQGCTSGEEPAATKPEEPSKAVEAVESNKTDEPDAAPEVVKVGFHAGITGGTSPLGEAQANGFKLAVKEINEAGGILGKQIVPYIYDDKASPDEAVKCVTRLIQNDKVDMIVGSFNSSNVLAVGDMIEEAKIPYAATSGTASCTQQGWTYVFRSMLCSDFMQTTVLDTCVNSLDCSSIMVFHTLDDYGVIGEASINKLAPEYGMDYLGAVSMQNLDPDLSGQCQNVVAKNPDAIYLFMVENEMPNVVKQLRAAGYTGWIVGEQGLGTSNVENVAGDSYDHILFCCTFMLPEKPEDAVSENLRVFFEDYNEEFGLMPTSDCACRSYDGLYLLKRAAEDAGTIEGTAVRDAVLNITDYEGLFGTYDFVAGGGAGEGLSKSNAFIVEKGVRYILADYLATR